ncbi:MAG: hypothetical protein VKJ04_03385 [Vampirovibrionales bacterium]|nr:hypothetical protein [Vampirovibrionales bacterium]
MSHPPVQNAAPETPKKKKYSQERSMLLLTLVFIGGVVALTLIPEGHPLRPFFMPIFIIILAWAIFKKL